MKKALAMAMVFAAYLGVGYVVGEARTATAAQTAMKSCTYLGTSIPGTTQFTTRAAWEELYFENRGTQAVTVEASTPQQDETATLQPGTQASDNRAVFPDFIGGDTLTVTASSSGIAIFHCQ